MNTQLISSDNSLPPLITVSRENEDVVSLSPEEHLIDVVTAMAAMPGFTSSPVNGAEYLGETVKSDFMVFPDAKPRDVGWKYDISAIRPYTNDSVSTSRYSYHRLKSLSAGDCKSLGVGHAARLIDGVIRDDGSTLETLNTLAFWRNGQYIPKMKFRQNFRNRGDEFISDQFAETYLPSEVTRSARLLLGVAFSQHYFWAVKLGVPGRQLRLSCEPSDIRDFFELRDVGPKGRREALKHWVTGHWRKIRRSGENEEARTWVRNFLRGKLDFRWNGIDCQICISADDLLKNAARGKKRGNG